MVVFDDDGSCVLNKMTGEVNWMREESGNDIMDLWVMPSKGQGFYEATLAIKNDERGKTHRRHFRVGRTGSRVKVMEPQ